MGVFFFLSNNSFYFSFLLIVNKIINTTQFLSKCFVHINFQGSGKTLAFGIPILHRILNEQEAEDLFKPSKNGTDMDHITRSEDDIGHNRTLNAKSLLALIMTPTRELAIQIKAHLQLASKYTQLKVRVVN